QRPKQRRRNRAVAKTTKGPLSSGPFVVFAPLAVRSRSDSSRRARGRRTSSSTTCAAARFVRLPSIVHVLRAPLGSYPTRSRQASTRHPQRSSLERLLPFPSDSPAFE